MRRRSDILKSSIGCSPTMYQSTLNRLSPEQLAFLNRGPSYVPPCQMHSLSISIDQLLRQQMAPLHRQLASLFTKYPVDLSRQVQFQNELEQCISQSFGSTAQPLSIPPALRERVLHEKQLIQSIRNEINQQEHILRRTADNQNTYCLRSRSLFNFKSYEHVKTSNSYELIGPLDTTAAAEQQQQQQQNLNKILRSIDDTLTHLLDRKLISKEHHMKFTVSQRKNIKLPSLYFLPEVNPDGAPLVQPRISSSTSFQTPTKALATSLEQLLRPLFEHISQSTRFDNGGDFIKRLQFFCSQQNFLRSTTRFVTFEIQHLYTHLSHSDLLTGVHRLLHYALVRQRQPQGITSEGIEELTKVFLANQLFTYDGNIYRYVKGCPLDSPLSRLLFNIYLYYWQITLVRPVRLANEFFGLYHATGFLTWNQSRTEQIQQIFTDINQSFESPIRLTTSIDSHVNYLHCSIENRRGRLYTRVYHDPGQQPFLLPYFSQHPRLYHRKWFRFALLRAGLYCTQVEDFYDEQLNLELTFLANGYSLPFVEMLVQQLYRSTIVIYTETRLDQHRYNLLRTHLFRYHSAQVSRANERNQLQANEKLIHLEYLFDWGVRWEFDYEFTRKWSAILEEDPKFKKYGLQIKLRSKHCFPSNLLLTHSQ